MQDAGQLVVRESIQPGSQDLMILKSVLPDQFRKALEIPLILQRFQVLVLLRTYERSSAQLRLPYLPKVDYKKICGGIQNLMSLFTQDTSKDHPFLLMKDTEDAKLVLEKLVIDKIGRVQVTERILIRLANSLMTPSMQEILPSDLKVVKEIYSDNKRQLCTIKLSHKTGIPLPNATIRKSLEDVEVFEEDSQVPQPSLILSSGGAKKLSTTSLHALMRMFYESHRLGSSYVLLDSTEGFFKLSPIAAVSGQPQITSAEEVSESIRFKPLDQGLEVDRTVVEDGVCVQEQTRVVASQEASAGPKGEGQPYDSTQAKLDILGENIRQKVFIGAGQEPEANWPYETEYLKRRKVKPEFCDAMGAMFEIPAPETQSVLANFPKARTILLEKRETSRTIFRKVLVEDLGIGKIQTHLLEKVEIQKDETLASILGKIPQTLKKYPGAGSLANISISERDEPGCLYSYFVKETYDPFKNQRVLRRLAVPDDTDEDGERRNGATVIVGEEVIKGVPPVEQEEVNTLVKLLLACFNKHGFLFRQNTIITEEVQREGSVSFERREVFSEGDQVEGDLEAYFYVREAIELDSTLLFNQKEEYLGQGVRYNCDSGKQCIQSIEVLRQPTTEGPKFKMNIKERIVIGADTTTVGDALDYVQESKGLDLALRFVGQTQPSTPGTRLVLLEDRGSSHEVAQVLLLRPDLDTNLGVLNPLKHRPLRISVSVDEKLQVNRAVTDLFASLLSKDAPSSTVHEAIVGREVLISNRAVLQEQLRLSEDPNNPSGKVTSQSVSRREGTARPEDWLSPVDHSALSKVFGMNVLNRTASDLVILRRQIEKDGVVYEKIAYRPSEPLEKRFVVLERYFMQEAIEAVMPGLTSIMFGASSIEDFGKAKRMSRLSRDPNTGAARSDVLTFDHDEPQLLRQSAAQSLFGLAESEIVRKGIPLLLLHASQVQGNTKLSSPSSKQVQGEEKWTRARPEFLTLIRALVDAQPQGQGFVIGIDEGTRLEGRKVDLELDESQPGFTRSFALFLSPTKLVRDKMSPEQQTLIRETIEVAGDQFVVLDQKKEAYVAPPPGKEPLNSIEYYIRNLTKLRKQLKSSNFYIKRTTPTQARVVFEAYELAEGGKEILRERVEVKGDGSPTLTGIRQSFLNNNEIEELLTLNPQNPSPLTVVSTKIVQHNPPSVYRGEAQKGERIISKSPFDFENALNAFLGGAFEGNYIVSQRLDNNDKVIEKIVVQPSGAVVVVDKFVLNNQDLMKRLGANSENIPLDMKDPKPADSKEFMRLLGSATDQENLYLVRVVQNQSGQPIKQVLKLLKNQSDPNTGPLARLGSAFMPLQEARREVLPLLQSKDKLGHYLTPSQEVEYVVIKESPLHSDDGKLKDEVVGYEMNMNPIFKGQLQNLRPAAPPASDNQDLLARIEFLSRTLADKQAEVQRFDALVKELTLRVNNGSGVSEAIMQENHMLKIQLENNQRELLSTKQEMEELHLKYQQILADLNALMRARQDLEAMRDRNQELESKLRQIELLYQESVVTIKRFESLQGSEGALNRELENARREIQRLQSLLLSTEESRGALEARISSLEKQIRELQEIISKLTKEKQDLLAQLAGRPSDDPSARLAEQISTMERTVTTLRTTITSLESDKDQLRAENQRLKDEIARLKVTIQELESRYSSHTRVEKVVTQIVSDDGALSELRRQNGNLGDENQRLRSEISTLKTEITTLRTEISQLRQELSHKPERGNSPNKVYLTTVTGIKYGNGGAMESRILSNQVLDVAPRRSTVMDDQASFEVDRDSELYAKYVALRTEYNNLFLDNDQLRNENNRLRSDIITLSGQNLTPDLVALNSKQELTKLCQRSWTRR